MTNSVCTDIYSAMPALIHVYIVILLGKFPYSFLQSFICIVNAFKIPSSSLRFRIDYNLNLSPSPLSPSPPPLSFFFSFSSLCSWHGLPLEAGHGLQGLEHVRRVCYHWASPCFTEMLNVSRATWLTQVSRESHSQLSLGSRTEEEEDRSKTQEWSCSETKFIEESGLKPCPFPIGQDQCFCFVRTRPLVPECWQTGTETRLSLCQGLPQARKSGGKRHAFIFAPSLNFKR